MTIHTVDGSILEEGGQIADSVDCCCDAGAEGCCSELEALEELTIDFGAGGWTDFILGPTCTLVAGDVVLTKTVGLIRWFTVISGANGNTIELTLQINNAEGNCKWTLGVLLLCLGGTGSVANFESASEAQGDFDCTDFPVSLTKLNDVHLGICCTGTLPATITLEA